MIGIKHLGIAAVFFTGMTLIDLGHKGLSINQMWRGFIGLPIEMLPADRMFHHPLLFYILLAFTLGVGLHLICDRVKL